MNIHTAESCFPGDDHVRVSLEGYVNAKVLVEGIRRTKVITPENVTSSLRRLKGFDVGGMVVDLTDPTKSGLKFVDIGIITRDGNLRF